MLKRNCFLLALTAALVFSGVGHAIIVETRDGKVYRGYLVEQNALRVSILLEGSKKRLDIPRSKVSSLVRAVDDARLANLKPGNWADYFQYAQELMTQSVDPEARDTALRLFHICVYQDPKKYAYTGLLRMASLGRTPQEKKAFRAMAYLLDQLHDKGTLRMTDSADDAARRNFLGALVLLRRGKTKEAKELAQKPGVKKYFDSIPGLMSYEQFLKICDEQSECPKCKTGRVICPNCAGNKRKQIKCQVCNGKGWIFCQECGGSPRRVKLTPGQLALILRLQLAQEESPEEPLAVAVSRGVTWSDVLATAQLAPIPVLAPRYLTEFDPTKTVFSRGKWVSPSGS